jgi:hypothetical protein
VLATELAAVTTTFAASATEDFERRVVLELPERPKVRGAAAQR